MNEDDWQKEWSYVLNLTSVSIDVFLIVNASRRVGTRPMGWNFLPLISSIMKSASGRKTIFLHRVSSVKIFPCRNN